MGYLEVNMRYLSILIVLSMMLIIISACSGGEGTSPVAPTFPSGKPTGTSAEAGDKSATVSWNPVSGAVGYYVYRSGDGIKFRRVGTGLVAGTSLTVFELTNYTTYFFGVSAVGSGGWETSIAYPGGAPNAVEIIPIPYEGPPPGYVGNPPEPPRNLQGVAKDAACELKWDPPSFLTTPDLDFYKIYRMAQVGDYSTWPILEDSWTDTDYRDDDLENGQDYSYRVTSIDTEDFESVPSNWVTLHPMDFPPETLQNVISFLNFGRVVLEFDNPEETDIAYYSIERVEGDAPLGGEIIIRIVIPKPTSNDPYAPEKDDSGFIWFYLDLDDNRVVITDTAVEVGKTYKYRLAAIDAHEPPQEGPSIEISAGPVY